MQNRCLGIFLMVLTIPMVFISIVLFSSFTFLKLNYYEKLFIDTDAYNQTITLLNKTNTDNALVQSLVKDVTPTWLKTNIESNLKIAENFIDNKSDKVDFAIDIRPFKGDIAKQLPTGISINIPDEVSFATYQSFLTDFRDSITAQSANLTPEQLASFNEQINSTTNIENKARQNLLNIRSGIKYYRIATFIIFALTLVGLLLIALSARKYPPLMIRLIGYTLLIPSFFSAIISFIIRQFVLKWSPFTHIGLSPEAQNFLFSIYQTALEKAFGNIMFISISVFIFSLILVVGTYVWSHYSPLKSEAVVPAHS